MAVCVRAFIKLVFRARGVFDVFSSSYPVTSDNIRANGSGICAGYLILLGQMPVSLLRKLKINPDQPVAAGGDSVLMSSRTRCRPMDCCVHNQPIV